MLFKTTKQLFKNTYQYKIVLVCGSAGVFRTGDMDNTLELLNKIDVSKPKITGAYNRYATNIKTQDELDYALGLQLQLTRMTAYELRVEQPWITIYSNNKQDIDTLANLDQSKVKYVCVPPANVVLQEGTVIMPKMPFEYRVTLGKTTQNHSTFVEWAEKNKKLRLTKSSIKELNKSRSWGGTHFYVTGDNNILMVKMHLGGSINKIDRILKA